MFLFCGNKQLSCLKERACLDHIISNVFVFAVCFRVFSKLEYTDHSPPWDKLNYLCLSTDHCVHYYDLRNTTVPITVFKGHRKAVSYTKFINTEEIVSA